MIISVIFWWGGGLVPAPQGGGVEGGQVSGCREFGSRSPSSCPCAGSQGAPAVRRRPSAKWVTGNGKWGEEQRQGLGQRVHGEVRSGITRKKKVGEKKV